MHAALEQRLIISLIMRLVMHSSPMYTFHISPTYGCSLTEHPCHQRDGVHAALEQRLIISLIARVAVLQNTSFLGRALNLTPPLAWVYSRNQRDGTEVGSDSG